MNITPVRPGNYDFHVVPVGEAWAIKREDASTYSGIFTTQAEAIGLAITQARQSAAAVILHGTDGRFRQVWNYA